MKILIVEDEIHIARHLSKLLSKILPSQALHVKICLSLTEAADHLNRNAIDLLMLDLNLRGENGFELLQMMVSNSFHVVIVSAHTEKAIEAFEYGVLDFVPKPFNEERIRKCLSKLEGNSVSVDTPVKYLMIKKKNRLEKIDEKEVLYFEAYGHYSKMHLRNGRVEVYDKALIVLEPLLDDRYERVHKSYIAKMTEFDSMQIFPGGKYLLVMSNEDQIPVGRGHYKRLKQSWFK